MERLGKEDWMKAARLALLKKGVSGVRVEVLASELSVTKGSFYWHFAGRGALLEALLKEWEDEADLLIGAVGAGEEGAQRLIDELRSRIHASESGEMPSDAAIFGWAAVASDVAERVRRAEEERVELLATLIGDRERAEFVYMAYLGFILRRRHSANSDRLFSLLADAVASKAYSAAQSGAGRG